VRKKIDEVKLIELHRKGLSDKEIAKILDCNYKTVQRARRKLGLKPNKSKQKRLPEDLKRRIIELCKQGKSDKEIAEALKCKIGTVRYVRRTYGGIRKYTKRTIGERELKIIKDLNEAGFNDVEIAGMLGVSPATVRKHRQRMGLPAVGSTCCTYYHRIKDPRLRRKIEMCAKATMEFLDEYFKSLVGGGNGRNQSSF